MVNMADTSHLSMCPLSLSKVVDGRSVDLVVIYEHSSSILSLKCKLSLLSIDNGLGLSVGLSLSCLICKSR